MEPSSPSLEDQVRSLTLRLAEVEARLTAVEAREGLPTEAAAEPVAAAEAFPTGAGFSFDARRWTTALGRSFIILGGAFLLRAVTDAGVWPPPVGVSVGLLYAFAWIASSDRAATRGERVYALSDGATAVVIGFPLIVEAATRFRLFTADIAAVALTAFSALALVSAWKSSLRTLAWFVTVGGMFSGLTLMVRLGVVAPYSLYFTGLGVGALWLGYLREWKALRWPTGLLAAVGVLGVTSRAVTDPPVDPAQTAWLAQGALLIGYSASVAIRTLVRGRQVIVFEVVQTALVLAAGVGGALAVSRAVGEGGLVLGAALVALGLVHYLISFPFLPRESQGALNFYFYSTLALALVLVGLQSALDGVPRAVALTALAALLAAAWSRSGRVSLGGHAAVALLAAASGSGLLALAQSAFTGTPPASGGAALLGLLVAGLINGSAAARSDAGRPRLQDLPALTIAALAVSGLGGALTALAVEAARTLGLADMDPGALATVGTAVLAGLAVGCALVDRPGRFSAAGKMAYPLLVAIGVKLAVIDLRYSTPATLFAALACYGAALLLVPRLRRSADTTAS